MDGDIFGAVGRLGRKTAEALLSAIRAGQPLDPFLPARCLELVVNAADGIPSLRRVLACLGELADAPLLANVLRDDALEKVERAVHEAKGTVLDVIVLSVAQRRLAAGEFHPGGFAEQCTREILEHAIVHPRGGLVDVAGDDLAARDQARELLRSTAREAAEVFLQRPDAKRLNLSSKYKVDADTDLLGGGRGESS